MEKKINYMSRDFNEIRGELVKFSKSYYPQIADNFNDSSVGSWFLDLMAAVGDDLSYHTDRMYQETSLDSANSRSAVMNMARSNGYKVPGAKCAMCEIELSCVLPTKSDDISKPDLAYAPIIQRTSVVAAGNYSFELTEDVNFAEQFNSEGFSNRKIVPSRNTNGQITGYTISKSTIVVNGTTRVYKKVIYGADIQPFMEVVLPETNITNVESIIFKETSDYSTSPELYEYYIDAEEFRRSSEAVMTYRFFECDSLADQYRFGTAAEGIDNAVVKNIYNPEVCDPKDDKNPYGVRYYKGEWKPLRQKFITEYTDNGYLKIIFGSGNGYSEVPSDSTKFSKYMASKLINNDMLGVLPKEGWSMFVLYRVGGGVSTNLAPNSINKISIARVDWGNATGATNGTTKGQVINSLKVTNLSSSLGGKDAPSTEEIKQLIKYNTSSQNRAVTLKDYKVKLMSMPPKYGAPFRSSVIEANNKIEISVLGLDASKNLDPALPQVLVENIVEYMSHYKQINDYIEIKSGRVYDLGVSVDLFIDKNYDTANVVSNVINTVSNYFDVENHDMGEDIFIGDLEKEITLTDGVISLISLRIYSIHGGGYSQDECPLPKKSADASACNAVSVNTFNTPSGSISEEIDLDATERVLYGDYNAMYEIRNEASDIQVKVKTR